MGITVIKASGKKEEFKAEKMNQVVEWACEGLDVCPSEILMKSQIQLVDGVTTEQIHKTLIKSAADLITEDEPDYQYAAARLLLFSLRKKAYGKFEPLDLFSQIAKHVGSGKYDKHLLEDYTEEDINYLDSQIDHSRDFNYTYAAIRQYEDKYLVKDRTSDDIYESPQTALMLIAMGLLSGEKENRNNKIVEMYNDVSEMRVSLPTPIMAGVRTPTRQFSSCCLIEAGDDINQIFNASTAQGKYAAQRAGVGLNFGMIRGKGAKIRGGEVKHAGTVPIVRMYQEFLGWTSQGGLRRASSTYFYPIWHFDFEELIVLKNNRGTEFTRARHVDYGVQINKLFYTRLQKGQNISFFHPNVAGGKLYEYFFKDQDKFEKLYVQLEEDKSVERKVLPATEVFSVIAQERSQTGRIYIQHVDHCNTNSPFISSVAPIKQSNLCMEIALPTSPINNYLDPGDEGEIALCTLSAINLGKVNRKEDMRNPIKTLVRALDNLLDYQDYPVLAAEKTKKRRTLGIGWTNLAYYLAKRGLKYSDKETLNEIHELAEAFQYYLLEASVELAKERGACEWFNQTTYSQGILPIDRYKDTVDTLHTANLKMDWEKLRGEIKEYGLRNSTLSTMMPCETSSQITNSTNGFEPPRGPKSIKASPAGNLPMIVPGIGEEGVVYEYKWDMSGPTDYLNIVAIMQKFIDQSASTNTFYKPWDFPGGKLPIKVVLRDMMYAYKMGLKTLYYHETYDGNEQDSDDGCSSGACRL